MALSVGHQDMVVELGICALRRKGSEVNMFEGYFGRMILQVLGSLGIVFGLQLFIYWLINKNTKCNIPLSGRVFLSIAGTVIIYGITLAIIGE